jgi:hypothetical protein
VAVAFDQFINTALFFGHPDETISSHAGRAAQQGARWGKALCWGLNLIQRNHGELAEEGDVHRAKIIIAVEAADEVAENAKLKLAVAAIVPPALPVFHALAEAVLKAETDTAVIGVMMASLYTLSLTADDAALANRKLIEAWARQYLGQEPVETP